MSILLAPAPAPNGKNPRDSWPAWTDLDRWQAADLPDFLLPAMPDPDPFVPTREQEARQLGYELGRAGENPRLSRRRGNAVSWQFSLGLMEGRKARQAAYARAAGYGVGLISDIDEPPSGYSAYARAAYRDGWAAGQADDDRDTEAWIASERLGRLEDAFLAPIDDRDIYPHGGTT
jgi:hypothetical protein